MSTDIERLRVLARFGDQDAAFNLVREHVRRGDLDAALEDTNGFSEGDRHIAIKRYVARCFVEAGVPHHWRWQREDGQYFEASHGILLADLCYQVIPFKQSFYPVSIYFDSLQFIAALPWTVEMQRLWLCDCLETRFSLLTGYDPPGYTVRGKTLDVDGTAPTTSCLDLLIERGAFEGSGLISDPVEVARIVIEHGKKKARSNTRAPKARLHEGGLMQAFERIMGYGTLDPQLLPQDVLPTMWNSLVQLRPGLDGQALALRPVLIEKGSRLEAIQSGSDDLRRVIIETYAKIMGDYLLGVRV